MKLNDYLSVKKTPSEAERRSKFDNLPHDMRELPQWGFTKTNSKIALFVNQQGNTQYAESNNPYTWMSYKEAVNNAITNNGNIVFFLWYTDPFCCIDIDTRFTEDEIDNDAYKQAKWNFHQLVKKTLLDNSPTYAEISASGIDMHIWCKATAGASKKLKLRDDNEVLIDGIELYSANHYIVCTGDSIDTNVQICSYKNSIVERLIDKDISSDSTKSQLVDRPQVDEDATVISNLSKITFCKQLWDYKYAPSGAKFNNSAKQWSSNTYFSQSEADYALLMQLCKLTPNNEQVIRLFRESNLGKRPKAKRNSYLRTTLEEIRGTIDYETKESELMTSALTMMRKGNAADAESAKSKKPVGLIKTRVATGSIEDLTPPDLTHILGCNPNLFDIGTENLLDFPPGLIGEYAKWVCYKCTLPLVEGSIVHALGLVAGIAGRHYKINALAPTGINQQYILMGLSGIGKDVISDGFGFLRTNAAIDKRIEDFLRIGHKIASVNALREMIISSKYLSVIHYVPEFSKKLNAAVTGDKNAQGIIEEYLDLYNSTHVGRLYGDYLRAGHSKNQEEKSIAGVIEPSYSTMGDTTEGDLNKVFNTGMIEDGSLSRTICVLGTYCPSNHVPHQDPLPQGIIDNLNAMLNRVCEDLDTRTYIQITPEAEEILTGYNKSVMTVLHGLTADVDTAKRVAFSRSKLKVWRVAGALAAFENPNDPIITAEQLLWAIGLINRDSKRLIDKIDNHEIGANADDFDRMDAVRKAILEYLKAGIYKDKSLQRYNPALLDGTVVFTTLNAKLRGTAMFKADNKANKLPAATLISVSLKLLEREGFLRIMSAEEMQSKYGLKCEGYAITNHLELSHAVNKKYARG